MLLRRVIQHVQDQNWTAVVIDFLIVVLGVFMGIQVQGWYENQREERQVTDYLHRLNDDFSLSIAGTERTRDFVQSNLRNLTIIVDSLRSCSLPQAQRDDFANGFFHVAKLIPAQFVDGTLQELRASGRLLLLDHDELRDAINETVRENEYQERVWPALQQRGAQNRDHITSKLIVRLEGPINGFSNISWHQLEFDFEAACNDKVLQARLSDLQRMGYVNIDWLDRNITNFRSVRSALERVLETSKTSI